MEETTDDPKPRSNFATSSSSLREQVVPTLSYMIAEPLIMHNRQPVEDIIMLEPLLLDMVQPTTLQQAARIRSGNTNIRQAPLPPRSIYEALPSSAISYMNNLSGSSYGVETLSFKPTLPPLPPPPSSQPLPQVLTTSVSIGKEEVQPTTFEEMI